MKRVKGEGEEALPISSSYININSSCILIYLEQECRNPPFTFTLHTLPVGQIGQVPERVGQFLCVQINLPGARGQKGEVGEGVFATPPTGLRGSLGGRQRNQGARVYPAANRLPTSRWGCPSLQRYRPQAGAFEPNPIPVPDRSPADPFGDIRHRHAVNNLVASGHHRGR